MKSIQIEKAVEMFLEGQLNQEAWLSGELSFGAINYKPVFAQDEYSQRGIEVSDCQFLNKLEVGLQPRAGGKYTFSERCVIKGILGMANGEVVLKQISEVRMLHIGFIFIFTLDESSINSIKCHEAIKLFCENENEIEISLLGTLFVTEGKEVCIESSSGNDKKETCRVEIKDSGFNYWITRGDFFRLTDVQNCWKNCIVRGTIEKVDDSVVLTSVKGIRFTHRNNHYTFIVDKKYLDANDSDFDKYAHLWEV